MLRILFRVDAREPLGDNCEICSGFADGYARFEMGNNAPVMREIATEKFRLIGTARHPEINATPGKARRRNADERAGNSVQRECLSYQGRIRIELANPGGMTQYENRGSARLIIRSFQGAPEQRGNAKKLKRAWRAVVASHPQITVTRLFHNVIREVGHHAVK